MNLFALIRGPACVMAICLLFSGSESFAQSSITQDQLKAQVVSRVEALATAIDQQATTHTLTADKLAAAPASQTASILAEAQRSDPSIASVAAAVVGQGATPGVGSTPKGSSSVKPGTQPSVVVLKGQAVAELEDRSKMLSAYSDQLKILRNNIDAAPADQVLVKLRETPIPARVAELVFDPQGERLPSSHARVRQISAHNTGSKHGLTPFIVGSGDGTVDFPSVGAIIYKNPQSDLVTRCTGTLISPSAVLTAAHCINLLDTNDGQVKRPLGVFFQHAGFHTISQNMPPITYKDFKEGQAFGDIAVIFLSDPVTEFSPARLNTAGHVPPNSLVELVGFGWHNLPNAPAALNTTISNNSGIKVWGKANTTNCNKEGVFNNQRSIICFHYAEKPTSQDFGATCHGDSGGPLFTLSNGSWVLAGVTWSGSAPDGNNTDGSRACKPGAIDADVEVIDFMTFIKTALAENPAALPTVHLQPLDPVGNVDSRYAVTITDSVFQPADPSFPKNFSIDGKISLVRVTMNTTARGVGVGTGIRLEVTKGNEAAPICSKSGTDTYLDCPITGFSSSDKDWLVKVSGAPGQEFQVVATLFAPVP